MKYRDGIGYKPITDEQIGTIVGSCNGVDSDGLRYALDEAAKQFIHAHYEQQAFPHDDLAKRLNNIKTTAARLLELLNSDGRSKRQLGHIKTSARRLHNLLTFKTSDSVELESILNFGHTGEKEKARRESFNGQLAQLIAVVKLLSEADSFDTKIQDISMYLTMLERVASHGGKVQEIQKTKSKSVNTGDSAFTKLFLDLCNAYMSHFNLFPRFSVGDGPPRGTFATFIQKTLEAIKNNLSDEVKESDPAAANGYHKGRGKGRGIVPSLTKSNEAIRTQWKRTKSEFDPP